MGPRVAQTWEAVVGRPLKVTLLGGPFKIEGLVWSW
jgi:hypothetical protein